MKLSSVLINEFKGIGAIEIANCGSINALVGKNNSGKSSILHAIDLASLALEISNWNQFQPKLDIKDLINDAGRFSIGLGYEDGSTVTIKSQPNHTPVKEPEPNPDQLFKSILIWPDVSTGMKERRHKSPRDIFAQVNARNFRAVDSLEILYAIKHYALRNQNGLCPDDYRNLLAEIRHYFPDIEEVESDCTDEHIATLRYTEYGKKRDILYSGSGLKHFIDVLVKTTISGANVILIDEPEMGLHPDLQRQFIEYLQKLVKDKSIQVFLATHSQVLLNYADTVTYYRMVNSNGMRKAIPVSSDAIHTLLGDLGLRPSDVFNQDICLMVEGATDVVFFEHIIRNLYTDEFKNIAIGVLQYGGSAAEGIVNGAIDVANIAPAQKYTYWIRDRDKAPTEHPSSNSTMFKNALGEHNLECHIWSKREIEFYFPEVVLVAAQQGDQAKESAVRSILLGNQSDKFRDAAKPHQVCVPSGKYLRKLLKELVTDRSHLDPEIKKIVEEKLIPWKNEILGVESQSTAD